MENITYLLLQPHLVSIFTTFIAIVAIIHLLSQRKKPKSIVAWSMTIILLPFLGIALYLLFSGRKLKHIIKKMKMLNLSNNQLTDNKADNEIEEFLHKNSIPYASKNNYFYLCEDGVDSYKKLIKILNNANKSIFILTYIFSKDDVTKEIVDILAKKAQEGVEVKLLIDAIGSQSLELNPSFLESIQKAGGEYQFFMSFFKNPTTSKLNLRNHRKMIIVDQTTLLSGGINISSSYINPIDSKQLWRDIAFITKGSSVQFYTDIFISNWEFSSQNKIQKIDAKKEKLKYGNSTIQVVPSGPDVSSDALYESILLGIYGAKTKIYIVSPYFAPDSSIVDALIIANHKGVEINIISPYSSDHALADISRSAFLRELYEQGINIYQYKDKMLHAKAMIVDDNFAILGSANFDSRSFFYNFEVVSFIYSKDDINSISKWVNNLKDECAQGLPKASFTRVVVENFFKIFAPAL